MRASSTLEAKHRRKIGLYERHVSAGLVAFKMGMIRTFLQKLGISELDIDKLKILVR